MNGISDHELFDDEKRCVSCGIPCAEIICADCERYERETKQRRTCELARLRAELEHTRKHLGEVIRERNDAWACERFHAEGTVRELKERAARAEAERDAAIRRAETAEAELDLQRRARSEKARPFAELRNEAEQLRLKVNGDEWRDKPHRVLYEALSLVHSACATGEARVLSDETARTVLAELRWIISGSEEWDPAMRDALKFHTDAIVRALAELTAKYGSGS